MTSKILKEINRVPRNITKISKRVAKCFIALLPESIRRKYFNMLPAIVVIVGQNCSLKCKNCANFSPYLAKMIPYYPYEEICQDIEELTKHTQLKRLQFQGGEFFLHPNALQILEYVAQNPRIHQIEIATNATIVPKDSILKVIKQSGKIMLRLSNYGEVNAKSAEKLVHTLKAMEIPFYGYTFIHNKNTWIDCGGVTMTRLKDKVAQKIFKECIFGQYCLTMENGFISRCSRAVVAHLVQNFTLSKDDGILIRPNAQRIFNNTNPRLIGGGGVEMPEFNFENLQSFLHSMIPPQACYYCYGTSGQEIPAGVQLNKEELKAISESAEKEF